MGASKNSRYSGGTSPVSSGSNGYTTFSLDLLALLTAPLAFTFFDWQDAEGRPNQDPLALLEALRRYADETLRPAE